MRTSRGIAVRANALALAAATAVAVLAGCGSTGKNGVATKSTGAIVATAEDAVVAASSVHIQGQFTSGGEHVVLDLRLVKDKGASGTVTIDDEVIELLRIGPDVYVKGDEQFYRSVVARFGDATGPSPSGSATPTAPHASGSPGASATPKSSASTPGDITVSAMQVNYLHIGPTDAQYQTFASLTDPRQLVQQIMQGVGSLDKDGQKDIRGTKSIVLSGKKDTRVYVAIDGSPWLLRVLPPGGGTLEFLDYDKPVTLNPPPAAQVVDIAKIMK
ncbi:MAG: hypothetical protein HOV83_01770 [Catenulispora sp.]|nr:hypothetical protein [Catenulispora sp.]